MNNTFVIITWNSAGQIGYLLSSIQKYEPTSAVVIVDNASSDETVDIIKQYSNAQVKLIRSKDNLGFAKANNLAMKSVQTRFVTLINPDAVLRQPIIQHLTNEYHSNIGLIGIKILNKDGSLQPSKYSFQRPLTILIEQFGLGKFLPYRMQVRLSPENTDHSQLADTDWLLGTFLFTSVHNYQEIGGFSEDYFLYSEDMDIAYKYHLKGLRVIFDPSKSIIHQGGASEQQTTSAKSLKLLRSFCIFARKYHLSGNIPTLYHAYQLKAVIFKWIDPQRSQRYQNNVKYLRGQLK